MSIHSTTIIINVMISMMRKRTMSIAEETYLYEKVQDPGLNMGADTN